MDSRELAAAMARAAGIDLASAQKALAAIPATVKAELGKGGSVRLGSMGTFRVYKQPARTYKDPRTKQIVSVPAKLTIRFNIARGKKTL